MRKNKELINIQNQTQWYLLPLTHSLEIDVDDDSATAGDGARPPPTGCSGFCMDRTFQCSFCTIESNHSELYERKEMVGSGLRLISTST